MFSYTQPALVSEHVVAKKLLSLILFYLYSRLTGKKVKYIIISQHFASLFQMLRQNNDININTGPFVF
jgi:hypothetical protein